MQPAEMSNHEQTPFQEAHSITIWKQTPILEIQLHLTHASRC